MKQYKLFQNNLFVLKFYFRHAPLYSSVTLLNAVLQRISFVLLLQYSLLFIIDNIENDKTFQYVTAIIIGIFIFSVVITFIDRLLAEYYKNKINEKLTSAIQQELFEVSLRQDAENFDNPEFYDKYYNAVLNTEKKFADCYNNVVQIVCNITSVALLGGLLLSLSYVGTCIVLVTYVLSMLNNIKVSKLNYDVEKEKRTSDRKCDYFDKIYYLPEYIKEIKIHGVKAMLYDKIDAAYMEKENLYKNNFFQRMLHIKIFPFFIEFVLGDILYNGILLYQVIYQNKLSIGGFSALFFTAGSIKGSIGGLQNAILQFRDCSNYMEDLRKFMEDSKECMGTVLNQDVRGNIEIRNVSYQYKGEKKYALQNVSMEIPYGKKIAIVGTNGAGKTTLIKLLMRLYEIQQGSILLAGNDIREMELKSYRNLFGTVFQEFNVYALPLCENILMDVYNREHHESVVKALSKVGLEKGDNFVENLHTRLTNEFSNSDKKLSGGQKQKVAIARTIYGNRNFIILDEPSSALDPVSEYKFNETISEYAKGRTVIMISHRLSTTKDADYIYVFDQGKIVESGSHKELMSMNGKYAEMFLTQAQKYR